MRRPASLGQAPGRPPPSPSPGQGAAEAAPSAPRTRPAAGRLPRTTVTTGDDRDALAAQRALDARTPGGALVIDLDHRRLATPADALGEVLSQRAGVTVRSLGGLGQFSSVSMRGSSGPQVQFFLDGAPLTGSFGGLLDVGGVPLDTLARVEIHRGYVPIAFGGATIGGAIDLVGRRPSQHPTVRVGGGMGSFGTRQAAASVTHPLGRGIVLGVHVGYAGSAGTFRYYDTNGTPQTQTDDRIAVRRNADYDRILQQTRLDGGRDRVRWTAQSLLWAKNQGVPGPEGAAALAPRLGTVSWRGLGRVDREEFGAPGGRASVVASVSLERREFSDPRGEVGVGIDDQRTRTIDVYASPRLRIGLWRGAFLGLVGDARGELVAVDERAIASGASASGDAQRGRVGAGAGIELDQRAARGRVHVVPAVRVDGFSSRFRVPPGEGEQGDQGRDARVAATSPRLGLRVTLARGLDVRAAVGRYLRPPTLVELFGDRGYVIGNEGLRAESGTTTDLALTFDRTLGRTWRHEVWARVGGFAVFPIDAIQWIAAGPVIRPENLDRARILGTEVSGAWSGFDNAGRVAFDLTFLDTRNLTDDPEQRGRPLPGRPRVQIHVAPSLGWEAPTRHGWIEPRIGYDLEVVGATTLDRSGRLTLPARVLHGVSAELHIDRIVHIGLAVRNLANLIQTSWQPPIAGVGAVPIPVVDFIGYPLPGRSVFATLRIDLDPPPRRARARTRAARAHAGGAR